VNCRSTLQLAFGPVRLIPCAAGAAVQSVAGATGDVFQGAGRVVDRIRGSGGSDHPLKPRRTQGLAARAPTRSPAAEMGGVLARPAVAGGQMLLRLVVTVLAALSALLAAAAAVEREKRERVVQRYRQRLHS
jgi:hypothetical protein